MSLLRRMTALFKQRTSANSVHNLNKKATAFLHVSSIINCHENGILLILSSSDPEIVIVLMAVGSDDHCRSLPTKTFYSFTAYIVHVDLQNCQKRK